MFGLLDFFSYALSTAKHVQFAQVLYTGM